MPVLRLPGEIAMLWIRENPTAVKTMQIAAYILGIALIATLPISLPALGAGAAVLAITGGLLILAATVASYALEMMAPTHNDMKKHVFKTGTCEGGKLSYYGDVPILELNGDDPMIAGRAQGYLLGDAIEKLSKRYNTALHLFLGRPHANKLPHIIEPMKNLIPPEFLEEMKGFLEGYDKWRKDNPWRFAKKFTLDELILFQLMPDTLHLNTGGCRKKVRPLVGCSAIVERDAEKGPIFGRNLDWLPLRVTGNYSLIIHRKYQRQPHLSTVEVGVPGILGILTGMNEKGLSLAMNVCLGDTKQINGMPAIFFNRKCLQTCPDLPAVRQFVEEHSPLGPYHLTVADPEDAQSFHFHQGNQRYTTKRLEENQPLVVLNWRHEEDPYAMGEIHHSRLRTQILSDYFAKAQAEIPPSELDKEKLIEASLSLPCINNFETTHTVLMEPRTRTFKYAIDNGFSADSPLLEVPTAQLFGNNGIVEHQEFN